LMLDTDATPMINGNATTRSLPNLLKGLDDQDAIDIKGLSFAAGATASFASDTLVVTSGGTSVAFALLSTDATTLKAFNDGAGDVLIVSTVVATESALNAAIARAD